MRQIAAQMKAYDELARRLTKAEAQARASAIDDKMLFHLLRMALLHIGQRIAGLLSEPSPLEVRVPSGPSESTPSDRVEFPSGPVATPPKKVRGNGAAMRH